MTTSAQLQKEIEEIKARNKRVENDKAWETSKTRTFIISAMTYIIIALFLLVSNIPDPWINALVPSAAFFLSTLSLPVFKQYWLSKNN